jgi:hypothetical protein
MRKVTTRLAITLLTFSTGVAATGLWAPRPPIPAEEALAPALVVTEAEVASGAPGGWERVDIDGKVSFSLPPGMKDLPTGYAPGVDGVRRIGTTERGFLYLNYVYGKRAACDSDADFPTRKYLRSRRC